MDIETTTPSERRPQELWVFDSWPGEARDACAPEGAIPAWMRLEMSVTDEWAYAAEASS